MGNTYKYVQVCIQQSHRTGSTVKVSDESDNAKKRTTSLAPPDILILYPDISLSPDTKHCK